MCWCDIHAHIDAFQHKTTHTNTKRDTHKLTQKYWWSKKRPAPTSGPDTLCTNALDLFILGHNNVSESVQDEERERERVRERARWVV